MLIHDIIFVTIFIMMLAAQSALLLICGTPYVAILGEAVLTSGMTIIAAAYFGGDL